MSDPATFDLFLRCPLSPPLIHFLSPPSSFPSPCPSGHCAPPALCCDRHVMLVFGCAMCRTGRQPAPCVEPRGRGRVSPAVSLSLVGWGSTGAWMPPYHPAPATPDLAAARGRTPSHRHIYTHKLPSHLTDIVPGKAALPSSVEFAAIHPSLHPSVIVCTDSSKGTVCLSHSVVFTPVQMADQVQPCQARFCCCLL